MKAIKTVVFDMEGVLFRGRKPYPFASGVVKSIRSAGFKVAFLTNASVYSRRHYVRLLRSMAIPCFTEEVVTSSYAMACYLEELRIQRKSILVIGSRALARELSRTGNHIWHVGNFTGSRTDYVVVGFLPSFGYSDLVTAQLMISKGAKFLATDVDPAYPDGSGRMLPAAGWQVAALAVVTGQDPTIIGKPAVYALKRAIRQVGGDAKTSLVVGDNLWSDILAGNRLGCQTCRVLSGVTITHVKYFGLKDEIPRPDIEFPDISHLPRLLGVK